MPIVPKQAAFLFKKASILIDLLSQIVLQHFSNLQYSTICLHTLLCCFYIEDSRHVPIHPRLEGESCPIVLRAYAFQIAEFQDDGHEETKQELPNLNPSTCLAASVNCFLKASKLPKYFSISFNRAPLGFPPPLGLILFQKIV